MDITWHGYSCFSLKSKQATVLIEPNTDKSGLKMPSVNAQILLTTQDNLASKKTDDGPFVLNWPGEYEVKGVAFTVYSLPSTTSPTGETLAFIIHMDGIKVCYLTTDTQKVESSFLENLGDTDILILPVGGHDTMSAKSAHEIVENVEPRIVIPSSFASDEQSELKPELDGIEPFAKLVNLKTEEMNERFTVASRSELPSENTKCILLKAQL